MKSFPKNKRRQIVVDPQFQMRMVFVMSAIAAIEVVIGTILVMSIAMTSIWIPAGDHAALFYKFVLTIFGIVVAVTIFNVIIAILLSHRIAGPAYRLKQSMRQFGAGDLSVLINLREHDELQELKDEFNEMASSIRDKVRIYLAEDKKAGKTKATAKNRLQQKKTGFPFKLD